MKTHLWHFIAAASFAVLSSCSSIPEPTPAVSERVTMSSIDEVRPIVEDKIDRFGADRVLVVFDVDDTLLTMSHDLGGVGWYDWQDALGDEAGDQPGEIGSALFDVQGVLFEASQMMPVEEGTKELLNMLRARGVATHGLTARGPDYFGATYRELRKNDLALEIPTACEAPLCANPGVMSFEDVRAALLKDFSEDELSTIGLKTGRPAIVGNGLLMVAGQHKGLMLHLLLESYPESDFAAIVFVDDSMTNVENLMNIAPQLERDVTIVHYDRLNAHNEDLARNDERVSRAISNWSDIESAICGAMTSRICD